MAKTARANEAERRTGDRTAGFYQIGVRRTSREQGVAARMAREVVFQLRALKEPCPTDQALGTRPDLEDAARVPYYLFFDLARPWTG